MNKKRKIAGFILLTVNLIWSCQKDDTTAGGSGDYTLDTNYTVATVLAENTGTHELDTDYTWDAAQEATIVLNGSSITTNSDAVTIDGAKATIHAAGTYRVSGTLTNGQLRVAATDADLVRIVLDGVQISNANSAAIYILNAAKTIVVLADGTQNTLTDGSSYIYENTTEEEPNATLFSGDALTITGKGALTVNANFADAITSKDGLVLNGCALTITAKDDGIRGKDYLVAKSAELHVTAGGDGLKSDNDADATLGYVYVSEGTYQIASTSDAVQAATDVLIEKGSWVLVSGGGSSGTVSGSSAKGLKAGKHVVVDGGSFELNTADDAVHSNNNLCINGGDFTIQSKDDGMHADTTLSINGGTVTITKSYEGIESRAIGINGGTVRVTATDDGLNVAGGTDGSASGNFPGATSDSGYFIKITGGFTVVSSVGDGVDANGSIEMTGGTLLVNGPTAQNNAALDYDGTFNISGGTLVAVGSSGMAQAPSTSSGQNSLFVKFGSAVSGNTLVHLETTDGTELFTFKPTKNYQTLVFSSPELKQGSSFELFTGGSHSGTATDGWYQDGTYSGGSSVAAFTVSGAVTKVQ